MKETVQTLALKYGVSEKQIETDIVYLRMCFIFAEQSKAKRLKVGEFILTKSGVIVPGYNGTAPGTSNECEYTDSETGKLVTHTHVICGLQNGIYKAASEGVSLAGGTGYSTDSPCLRCVPAAISIHLHRFVYCRPYRLTEHLVELEQKGIQICHIPYELVMKINHNEPLVVTKQQAQSEQVLFETSLKEGSVTNLFYICNGLRSPLKTIPYNTKRIKGFTILVVKEGDSYSYLVANQDKRDKSPFERTLGRFFVYSYANRGDTFTQVPPEVVSSVTSEEPLAVYESIVNYHINTFVNKVKTQVMLPGTDYLTDVTDIGQGLLESLEAILLETLEVSSVCQVVYEPGEYDFSYKAILVVREDLPEETNEEEERELITFDSLGTISARTAEVRPQAGEEAFELVSKQRSLHKLFKKLTSGS